jgi:hypothetical protein
MIGYFDDAVIAAGIALCVNYEDPPSAAIPKENFRIRVQGPEDLQWMAT